MRDSKPGADALLRAGKDVFRPTAADRDRVLRSLAERLGDSAPFERPGDTGTGKDRLAKRLPKLSAAIGGAAAVALLVGSAALVSRARSKTPRRAPVTTVVAPSAPPEAPPDRASSPEESDETAAPSSTERSTTAPRPIARSPGRPSGDSLAEEVRLLALAEQQWNGGRAEEALATLREHERRFPRGALTEERLTARVEVLCALRRFSSARSELARLAKAFPGSTHLESARQYCGDELVSSP